MEDNDMQVKKIHLLIKNLRKDFLDGMGNFFKKKKKILDEYRYSLESKKLEMLKDDISNTFK